MTAPTLDAPTTGHDLPEVLAYGTPRLLAGASSSHRVDHAQHRELHGPLALRDRTWLSRAVHQVGLLGRGGASFPVGIKLDALPSGDADVEVLVNGSEGEPASWKDRVVMRLVPHLVLDGALGVAHALGTRRVTIAVHDDAAASSLQLARRERSDADAVSIVRTDDGFVGGEVRAVVNGLGPDGTGGGRAVVGGRRVLPTDQGLRGRPTFASNVETFAQLGLLLSLGPGEYARVGSTTEPGTTLVTFVGDVPRPGVVEVPLGVPLSALLPGEPGSPRPVLVGGYHGTWVRGLDGLTLERRALRAAGAPLGAGVVARLPHDTCALAEVAAVAGWLADESAGQCGPCFFGMPAVARGMASLASGQGDVATVLRHAGLVEGRGACAHPDGSMQLVRSALDVLADEVERHRRTGCGHPFRGVLPLPGSTPSTAGVR